MELAVQDLKLIGLSNMDWLCSAWYGVPAVMPCVDTIEKFVACSTTSTHLADGPGAMFVINLCWEVHCW